MALIEIDGYVTRFRSQTEIMSAKKSSKSSSHIGKAYPLAQIEGESAARFTWWRSEKAGTVISIWAKPGAKKSELVGIETNGLQVRIGAAAVDGAANEELLRFFASLLGLRQNQVQLLKGTSGRQKQILLLGQQGNEIVDKIKSSIKS